jgi:hypothetical protein
MFERLAPPFSRVVRNLSFQSSTQNVVEERRDTSGVFGHGHFGPVVPELHLP